MITPEHGELRRNLRLYTRYVGLQNLFFWFPIFFLYFAERVSFADVLLLEEIYYVGVVSLEVPSGYASDRWGRVPTLRVSAGLYLGAYVLFGLAASFWPLAAAQLLLAGAIAFNSGTDTAFHFDTLDSLGLAEEYGAREARLSRVAFWSTAIAALVGGATFMVDSRLPYALGALAALINIGLLTRMRDPSPRRPSATTFVQQLRRCVQLASSRPLRWYFAFAVCAIVINHIPYELVQPWLDQALGQAETTPLATGIHATVVAFVAGWAGGRSAELSGRLSVRRHLLLSMVLQVGLIALMAFWLHPIVGILLFGRSAAGALQRAPLRAAIAPHVEKGVRATYLSVQSLTGRLSWSIGLVALSARAGSTGGEALQGTLYLGLGIAAGLLVLLLPGGLYMPPQVSGSPTSDSATTKSPSSSEKL